MGDDDAKARNADLAGLDEPETHSGDVQPAGPSICAVCRHAHRVSEPWYNWVCLATRKPAKFNYVIGRVLHEHERCRSINYDGTCKLFEKLENPPERKIPT